MSLSGLERRHAVECQLDFWDERSSSEAGIYPFHQPRMSVTHPCPFQSAEGILGGTAGARGENHPSSD